MAKPRVLLVALFAVTALLATDTVEAAASYFYQVQYTRPVHFRGRWMRQPVRISCSSLSCAKKTARALAARRGNSNVVILQWRWKKKQGGRNGSPALTKFEMNFIKNPEKKE